MDNYFLSRKEYNHYVDGLLSLFLQAFSITPQTETEVDEKLALFSHDAIFSGELPPGLSAERFAIQQVYREMLQEKKLWDHYQQEQYKDVLESRIEPAVVDSHSLNLEVKDNLEYFLELESALKLHNRLVRDVRLFHDEVKYQKKQFDAQQAYQLYDLKLQLGPFARESAIADALQQAMSAISVGIYEREAAQVIDRLSEEFTKPVRNLYEPLHDTGETTFAAKYNYDIYVVYGKKLLNYSNALTQQSSVPLSSFMFGDLDFLNRRLIQSFHDLQQAEQNEMIRLMHLDIEELERDLF